MERRRTLSFRVTDQEYNDIASEAKEKNFKKIPSFIRYVIKKFYKQSEYNKDGLFDG